jgi:hypothetical protein
MVVFSSVTKTANAFVHGATVAPATAQKTILLCMGFLLTLGSIRQKLLLQFITKISQFMQFRFLKCPSSTKLAGRLINRIDLHIILKKQPKQPS